MRKRVYSLKDKVIHIIFAGFLLITILLILDSLYINYNIKGKVAK